MPKAGDIKRGRELGYKGRIKHIWHACVDCGKERWVEIVRNLPKNLRCHKCANGSGRDNKFWRGGKTKDNKGYIRVWLSPNDFFFPMANCRNYVLEHRLVVARYLNRCLLPWEIVHHKFGYAKDDNRYPETLELISDQRFHLVDSQVKAYIKRLEKTIARLGNENFWLRQLTGKEIILTK